MLAACQEILSSTICAQHVFHLRGEHDSCTVLEEHLALPDTDTNTFEDSLRGVVGGVAVEVAADAVLASGRRGHGDSDIQVVGPSHDLQVPSGEVGMHDFLLERALCIVDEFALVIVRQFDLTASARGWELLQDGLAVACDLAGLQGPDREFVTAHESAAQHDRVGGGQAPRVGRREEAGLDGHQRALDQPVLTLGVEVREAAVESLKVRIAPQQAVLGLACGDGRLHGRAGGGRHEEEDD
mmetsp:Transcript_68003/g.195201  ORF Transcript_68003/g.195201 Transcript_68003/m.195201 type:complete len:241 (-) Transcript_68003:459-1181(-)